MPRTILMVQDRSSFQKRPRCWRCLLERAENLDYVTWIRRSNPVHNIRIVNGRFSSRYVVRGLGFVTLTVLIFSGSGQWYFEQSLLDSYG